MILSWSNDSGVEWHNVTMIRTSSGTTQWFGSANILPQDIESTVQYKLYAQDTAGQWAIKDDTNSLYTGSRKAIIVNSDDRFYNSSSIDDFNSGQNSNCNSGMGNWVTQVGTNTNGGWLSSGGVGNTGVIEFDPQSPGEIHGNYTLNWNAYNSLIDFGFYNLSVQIKTKNPIVPATGTGIKVGLR